MPYISKENVKAKRNALKKEFPNVKFSVIREHSSVIKVSIMTSPYKVEGDYVSINKFHIEGRYKHNISLRDFLLKVYEIINESNEIESVDGDYGNIPAFYVSMSFGKWDKPYKQIEP